jgi:hypothetical protein
MKRITLYLAALFMVAGMANAQHPSDEPLNGHVRDLEGGDLAGPVGELQKKLASGEVKLDFEPAHGYLVSLLKQLNVPVSSQALVFSKTSFQRDLISPQTPRALYFNDAVYVGWVPKGDVIEVSEAHPKNGANFYTLTQRPNARPSLTRRTECLQCHDGLKTMGMPGHLMGSTFTASNGAALFSVDRYRGGHRSPLSARWGGWYVTGTHPHEVHLGNAFLLDRTHPEQMDLSAGANLTDLRHRCDTSRYLSPHSDLAALLVLEHQVRMHNLIAQVNREACAALAEQAAGRERTGIPTDGLTPATRQRISHASEALLEYMLFRDEAVLKGPLKGTSAFAEEFQQHGPRDSKGRSLRQLDLNTRLLRYPCSYLIYSEAFDALPREAKHHLWRRLDEILSGKDHSEAYASMKREDRDAVLEILRETKPEFAAWIRDR